MRARGAEAFEAAADQAAPLSELLYSTLLGEADRSTLEGRARIVERAAALVAAVPAGAFRTMLADRAAEIGRVERDEVLALARDPERSRRRGAGGPRPEQPRGADQSPSLVRQAIRLLLHQPSLAEAAVRRDGMMDVIGQLELKGAPLLAELLRASAESPRPSTAALVERYRDHEAGPHLARLAGESLLIEDEGAREAEFAGTMHRLREFARRARLEQLRGRAQSGALDAAGKEEYRRLLAEGGQPPNPA